MSVASATPYLIHTISSYDVFGPEKTILNECRDLLDEGWPCRIVNLWERDDIPFSDKVRARDIPYTCLSSNRKFDFGLVRALAAELPAGAIAHSHGYKADFYTVLAARRARVAAVTTVHGWTSENVKVRLYERLQAFSWRFFDRVIAVSRSYLELAQAAGVPANKLELIYNGIKPKAAGGANRRSALRTELGIPVDALVVAIIGRLGPEKGHRAFLQAAATIAGVRADTHFLIVGEGAEHAALQAYVAERGLDARVAFAGHRDDVDALYDAIDVVAIASLREGLPNVLLEAMLNGVPVVAMGVGGIPEVIPSAEYGVVVPPGDVVRFTRELTALLADPARRQRIGAKAQQRIADEFLFSRRTEKMKALYVRTAHRSGNIAP